MGSPECICSSYFWQSIESREEEEPQRAQVRPICLLKQGLYRGQMAVNQYSGLEAACICTHKPASGRLQAQEGEACQETQD